jgi:putative intracellular protease/amidase
MTTIQEGKKQVLIPIATGSCETETIIILTTLQMFDAFVVLASVGEDRNCCMAGGFMMMADITIKDVIDYDWDLVVIPGGRGESENDCHQHCSKRLYF